MCSNPGGGTSQYSEGFLRFEYFFFSARGERERLRSRDLDLQKVIPKSKKVKTIPQIKETFLNVLLVYNFER